jgi:hypothetical protein
VPIKSLKPKLPPAATRERRMTLAIEPRVAELIRQITRHEHILLSEFLEQAVIAWIRRWREDEYSLQIDGPEGPQPRTRVFAIGDGDHPGLEDARGPAVGVARRIPRSEVDSVAGFQANPARRPQRKSAKPKPKR